LEDESICDSESNCRSNANENLKVLGMKDNELKASRQDLAIPAAATVYADSKASGETDAESEKNAKEEFDKYGFGYEVQKEKVLTLGKTKLDGSRTKIVMRRVLVTVAEKNGACDGSEEAAWGKALKDSSGFTAKQIVAPTLHKSTCIASFETDVPEGEDLEAVRSKITQGRRRLDGSRYLQGTVFSSTQSIEEVPDVVVPDMDRTVFSSTQSIEEVPDVVVPDMDRTVYKVFIKQELEFTGITKVEAESKKTEIEGDIAASLGIAASDVKIISITEVDVRRRRLLAKKLIIVYEVGAKDDGAALAISDKMNSDAFADTLKTKVSTTTGKTISVAAKKPILPSGLLTTTTATPIPPTTEASVAVDELDIGLVVGIVSGVVGVGLLVGLVFIFKRRSNKIQDDATRKKKLTAVVPIDNVQLSSKQKTKEDEIKELKLKIKSKVENAWNAEE